MQTIPILRVLWNKLVEPVLILDFKLIVFRLLMHACLISHICLYIYSISVLFSATVVLGCSDVGLRCNLYMNSYHSRPISMPCQNTRAVV